MVLNNLISNVLIGDGAENIIYEEEHNAIYSLCEGANWTLINITPGFLDDNGSSVSNLVNNSELEVDSLNRVGSDDILKGANGKNVLVRGNSIDKIFGGPRHDYIMAGDSSFESDVIEVFTRDETDILPVKAITNDLQLGVGQGEVWIEKDPLNFPLSALIRNGEEFDESCWDRHHILDGQKQVIDAEFVYTLDGGIAGEYTDSVDESGIIYRWDMIYTALNISVADGQLSSLFDFESHDFGVEFKCPLIPEDFLMDLNYDGMKSELDTALALNAIAFDSLYDELRGLPGCVYSFDNIGTVCSLGNLFGLSDINSDYSSL